jgi:putative tributyrin esterase
MAFLHCELKAESIRMVTSVCAILPQDFCQTDRPVKTLYLLHGRSHNYSVWTRYTSLEQYAEDYNTAIIMPEVNRSFYSNMKYGLDYQTYISEELPDLFESMFHISTNSKDRYIAGMSMGGYGALKTALLHPDRYAGCGAISAVTDILKHVSETPENHPKKQEFQGIFGEHCDLAPEDDIFFLASRDADAPSRPDIFIACGKEDHLYLESVRLHQHLQSLPYKVTFEGWSGVHDWKLWDEAVKRMLEHFFAGSVI